MMGWAAIEDFPCLEDRTRTPWRPDGLCSGRGQWLPVLFRMGRATDCREDASPSLPCHRCSGCTSPCGHAPCWWDHPHTPSTTSWACGDCTTNFSVGGCVVAGRGCVPRRPTSNSILPPKVENEVVSRPVPRESSPSRAGANLRTLPAGGGRDASGSRCLIDRPAWVAVRSRVIGQAGLAGAVRVHHVDLCWLSRS